MDHIICITGPTASGKTKLSVEMAKALHAEIVSFDSMQIYRRMDIGTAKATEEEKQGIAHHMIDILEPTEDYSVSRYVQDADRCVQDILSRGKTVILVGGTGLYVDALIAGREFAPFPSTGRREELTSRAETEGIEKLWEELHRIDPESAENIPAANRKRVIRALEVWYETGITMSEHNRRSQLQPAKYEPLWLGLDFERREDLYQRINLRVEEMFERGLEAEARSLLAEGIQPGATAMQAIGYKETVRYLQGEETLAQAIEAIQLGTRHYAKRQRTWFRRNEKIHWLEWKPVLEFGPIYTKAMQLAETI